MSWLELLVRDVVEPAALSILQWAWSFNPISAPPLFTLPFRFYAYSATSALLWSYELFPHWVLLTLMLFGLVFVLLIGLFAFCYPARFICRCLMVILKTSSLLIRSALVGVVRLLYWLWYRFRSISHVRMRRPHPNIGVQLPPAIVRPAILDRATAALAPPPPLRAFPAMAVENASSSGASPAVRSARRRQQRSVRRS